MAMGDTKEISLGRDAHYCSLPGSGGPLKAETCQVKAWTVQGVHCEGRDVAGQGMDGKVHRLQGAGGWVDGLMIKSGPA